ncbi:hypothetical protein TTHERM_000584531 (macronuclear) [Tetrahymena thermophila SB210]|uniref:Uncharacterized protein n=1 Tax=Tetrahymena thermophila (strain SB210) TaxID=312017 RepID=W7XH67_TETTS|nr:hypothetical protein TTHERM_000584531 [Tetrahymena thermophila SB210]EWS72364.1 hypothetical protein TTHERM_000584531 [Tetrahymena thermophila SB210]|eukprot:XP_012655086.1 hypothetical protein TTHERM_000584531 [Tetrahymena thermophila SB210]
MFKERIESDAIKKYPPNRAQIQLLEEVFSLAEAITACKEIKIIQTARGVTMNYQKFGQTKHFEDKQR